MIVKAGIKNTSASKVVRSVLFFIGDFPVGAKQGDLVCVKNQQKELSRLTRHRVKDQLSWKKLVYIFLVQSLCDTRNPIIQPIGILKN